MKFSINERILILGILNQFKGNLDTMAKILDDLKEVRVNDEEAKEIGLKQEVDRITWESGKAKEKEIKISKEGVDFVKKFIKEKNDKGEFTLADKDIIELDKKLA
jgi:hypothetical protein